jgi:hypothetical protein
MTKQLFRAADRGTRGEAHAILQVSSGDPEGRPPDPALRVSKVGLADRLRERLGHGVARDFSISGERWPVQAFDAEAKGRLQSCTATQD